MCSAIEADRARIAIVVTNRQSIVLGLDRNFTDVVIAEVQTP
jgi:phenylpyruvate tautomerase PptA (4-oxalocrotonate tautomerase family)